MIFASPFPYSYESEPNYYQSAYHQPSSSFDNQKARYLQKLRAVEEAKRHVEAERYQRIQAARQDYISRLQEEEASRQAYEVAKRRREMAEAKQVEQGYLYGKSPNKYSEDEEEGVTGEPIFRVIQGFDGNLYKVKVGVKTRPQPKPRRRNSGGASRPQSEDTFQLLRGPDGRIYRVKLQQQPTKEEFKPKPKPTRPMSTRADIGTRRLSLSLSEQQKSSIAEEDVPVLSSMKIPIRKSISIRRERSTSGKDKRNNKNVSVLLVEDASDSESEDDHKSVWRNRRPSPGQWIEPVQSSF